MKKYLYFKCIFLLLLLPIMSGCTALVIAPINAYNCLDTKLERKPTPIDKTLTVELQIEGAGTNRKEFFCERYYDGHCSSRGNFWSIREIGQGDGSDPSYMKLQHPELGTIRFGFFPCLYLDNPELMLKNNKLRFVTYGPKGEILHHYVLINIEGDNFVFSKEPITENRLKILKMRVFFNDKQLSKDVLLQSKP